ncbi:MAG: RsmB/NOP family class I SAM-dependent RNA methyltransferase [Caldilineaceae bacterium]|nr:RsmB/NOP family class I SAM-dependent RNA methyltransferase [Caldilineaceae bacterium]
MTDFAHELAPLPEAFTARLEQIIPAEYLSGVLAGFAAVKPVDLRVNTLVATVADVQAELRAAGFTLTPLPWYDAAFTVPAAERDALVNADAFNAGRIYVQDRSSMLAALALDAQPDETVLDLAAAPGGKTLLLAACMQGAGTLVAVESVKARFFRMRANLAQHGAPQVETYLMDGRAAGRRWPQRFDRVLLDAPCSSEARFTRHDPKSWAHWSPRKIKEAARKQKPLLGAAIKALRPGGVLLYCTCSFAPEENEVVVNSQLRYFADEVEIAPLTLPVTNTMPGLTEWRGKALNPQLARSVRLLPTEEMDGFFMCKLVKTSR